MATCPDCDGKGYIITCWDDLCANSDHCMHGDGEEWCRTCQGEGWVGEDDDYGDYESADDNGACPCGGTLMRSLLRLGWQGDGRRNGSCA